MARMISVYLLPALALLVVLRTLPAQGGRGNGDVLDSAIIQANQNGQACNQKDGCLGSPVILQLNNSIQLTKPLTFLGYNAHLVVVGNCSKKKSNRCVIDGSKNFSLFTFQYYGVTAKVELYNLLVQNFKDGVFTGTLFANTNSTNVIFRNNVGSVVVANAPAPALGGYPLQLFNSCRFIHNVGPVFRMGSFKYGLANNGTALSVKKSIFRGNTAADTGAVALIAGAGVAEFESTKFLNNTAGTSGGVIFASGTSVYFRSCQFKNNLALNGSGGAVAAESTFFNTLDVRFCSSTFSGNRAPAAPASADLFFDAHVFNKSVAITFCDTKIPNATVLPPPDFVTVNIPSRKECYYFC